MTRFLLEYGLKFKVIKITSDKKYGEEAIKIMLRIKKENENKCMIVNPSTV